MPSLEPTTTQFQPHPDLHTPFASAVPPTPGELAAASPARWERRGPLQRLVRVN